MKKLLIALAILAVAAVAQADILATWNFSGSNSTQWPSAMPLAGANLDANIASASLSLGGGFVASSSSNNLRANGTGWGGTTPPTLQDSSYVQISLAAASSYTLTVETITGAVSGSGTGVGGVDRWAAQADGGGYGWVIGETATANNTSMSWDITDTTGASVDLRYFASPTVAGGTWGFQGISGGNSIVINGTTQAIPEPATMSLLGLGALAMVLRRKMKK